MTPPPLVTAAIVTYNSAPALPVLIASLRAQRGLDFEVLFTDNASSDGTVDLLAAAWPGACHRNAENIGYTHAQNQNLARSRGRYLLFLNPDVSFGEDLFHRLATFLDQHPDCAIVGPTVTEGSGGRSFPPRRFYPGEGMAPLLPGWHRPEIAWVNGCCLMIRREVLQELGGLDTDFFLYQEESSLCYRARQRRYRIGWCEAATLWHAGKQSQHGLPEREKARRVYQGNATFWTKHYPPRTAAAMILFQIWICRLLLCVPSSLLRSRHSGLTRASLEARLSVCRDWRKSYAVRPSPVDLARVIRRHLQVMWRWLRTGAYPLDDY